MGNYLFVAVILIALTLGFLVRAKTSIKVFNYVNLGLLGLIFLWSLFVTRNLSGGLDWPWYFMMLIYGTPIFISLIIINLVEYFKKFKQQ